jgi:hypothetical protein
MLNNQWLFRGKLILFVFLSVSILGFFYFESSELLKFLVALLGLSSFLWAVWSKPDQTHPTQAREVLALFILYLAVFSLYNLLYGLGVQLYIVMIALWLSVTLLFVSLLVLDKIDILVSRPFFWLLASLAGLIVLEVFLSLSFWPIDPKIKSLIIVVVFYLFTNLVYLYARNVLRFKRVIGYSLVSFLIVALTVLNVWLSLRGV